MGNMQSVSEVRASELGDDFEISRPPSKKCNFGQEDSSASMPLADDAAGWARSFC